MIDSIKIVLYIIIVTNENYIQIIYYNIKKVKPNN